jgi:phosphoglycolate phosphatase
LGVAADRIAYVGDTNTDMKTAVSAGLFAMGVAWGFRTREELYQSGARVVYDQPSQLLGGLLDH